MQLYGRVLLGAALSISLTAFAAAETYDPTNLTAVQILAHARKARGTMDISAYTRVYETHSGGVDTTSTTYVDGDDWMTAENTAGFTSEYGSYHKQQWDENENGIVRLDSDFRALTDPNDLALEHPEDPKYRVRALGLTQTQPQEYAVELNPPGGSDQYRYYDAKTFLLDRVVTYEKDRFRHVVEYSDYRPVFHEMMAFSVHAYDGRPQNDSLTKTISVQKTTTPVSLEIPKSRGLFGLAGNAPVQLPVRFTQGGIVIRATIDGRGLDFLLDSGAAGLFIDPGVLHELGLTPVGRSSETIGGGDVDMGRVRIPRMSIGQLDMQNVVFTSSPEDDQLDGSRIVGLMGYDLIASAITAIDFKKQTVTLYPRAAFDPAAMGLRGLPLQLDDSIPRVTGSMEHVQGAFLIDTGAFGMLAYQQYIDKLPSAPILSTDYRIGTVGGSMNAQMRAVTDFLFGNINFQTVDVVVPAASTFDIPDYDAIIGRDALQSYQVYFDYADRMVYLKNNI